MKSYLIIADTEFAAFLEDLDVDTGEVVTVQRADQVTRHVHEFDPDTGELIASYDVFDGYGPPYDVIVPLIAGGYCYIGEDTGDDPDNPQDKWHALIVMSGDTNLAQKIAQARPDCIEVVRVQGSRKPGDDSVGGNVRGQINQYLRDRDRPTVTPGRNSREAVTEVFGYFQSGFDLANWDINDLVDPDLPN